MQPVISPAERGRLAYLSGSSANPFPRKSPEAAEWKAAFAATRAARPTWADDDLKPPAFLVRPRPARNAPLPAFVAARATRQWAPIRSHSREDILARINALIPNPSAPVEVWAFGHSGPQIVFDRFSDFEAWYTPRIGKFMHANAQETFTQIILDDYHPAQSQGATTGLRQKKAKTPGRSADSFLGTFKGAEEDAASKPKKAGRRAAAPEALGFDVPTETALQANPNAKFTRNGVTVDGVPYRSVLAAFEALKLPVNQHQKFRKVLKQTGSLPFVHEGKTYAFVVV